MSRWFLALCLTISVSGIILLGYVFNGRVNAAREFELQARSSAEDAARVHAQTVLSTERTISAGINFRAALERLGLDPVAAESAVKAAQSSFDLRRLRAGNTITVGRSVEGVLRSIGYQIDPDRILLLLPQERGFRAEITTAPSRTEVIAVTGQIRDSLFRAVTEAGERPELAMRLAEIFGWDLDFYTDPREGDTFRVLVEKKKYAGGNTIVYGKIYAAEYTNAGHPYQAVLFHDPAGHPAYYAPDGSSLQKAFLRSPLKFSAPITSHFSKSRFHPVLKMHRPHPGIDYGAPVGTPVQAIGNGHVVFAGVKPGAGNLVHLQHSNGYETMYLHLSRILVRSGQRIEQGQRIGLVGTTGLATGPHLDFRFLQHGAYRNFEHLALPPAQPVAKREWSDFAAAREKWLTQLHATGLAAHASFPNGPTPSLTPMPTPPLSDTR